MPPYHRHAAAAASASSSAATGSNTRGSHRAGGSRGHVPTWSTSSNEGISSNPMTFSRATSEEDLARLAGTTTSLLDDTHEKQQGPGWALLARRVRPFSIRKFLVFVGLVFMLFGSAWLIRRDQAKRIDQDAVTIDMYLPPIAQLPGLDIANQPNPVEWLRHNTIVNIEEIPEQHRQSLIESRPKAAFIALVRNAEVEEMVYSMVQLESRFNSRATHQYDWIFFNDEEFTEDFMLAVEKATASKCYFEIIPAEHWSVPPWIDTTRFDVGRQFMGSIGVGKAWLQSYHHMCRWNAGLFALEKRLANYDFFWRVEPGVDFSCKIDYDVFRFMRDNKMAYGFNMAILDDARSFPSLWDRTKTFIKNNKHLIHKDADYNWLLHLRETDNVAHAAPTSTENEDDYLDHTEYNNCQFYSNFEIGSLDFFRSEEHRAYFEYLDRTGGFYYERFGDAPIHTLSVSLFLPKNRIWYFRDIGYAHGLCEQCPPHLFRLTVEGSEPREISYVRDVSGNVTLSEKHRRWEHMSQDMIRQRGIPGLSCGCTVSAIDQDNAKLVPFESKQRKPEHACIRLFLGGKWIDKKSDWDFDVELAAGRDGSGGYILDGLESNPFLNIEPDGQT